MVYDIITVGSATVDAYIDTEVEKKSNMLCYPIGSKILINDIRFTTGGGGTNAAVSFSRLGFKTAFLGKIGSGKNAEIITRDLEKENVAYIGVEDKKEHTGYSIVLGDKKGERTILTSKGSNNDLKFSEINISKLKTNWFYFSSMMEESFETQIKLAHFAKNNNIKIAYNPSLYQIKKGPRYLKPLLEQTEIIILNKEEAQTLVSTKDLFEGLKKLGPKIVCITDGNKGSTAYDGFHKYTALPHNIKCIERTGAGDAFASGFVAGLIKKQDIKFALSLGSTNAESVIQYPGAKNILLTMNKAISIMKKHPVKIIKSSTI